MSRFAPLRSAARRDRRRGARGRARGRRRAEPGILDPGELVRYGVPVASLIGNLAAAGTLGALVLTCFALSRDLPEFERALRLAS